MGIERIEIEGFRSLKHVVWEPSNLNVNVLIGPNGSGKSNVLDALRLLSAAASGTFDELISKWRGFRALTWNYGYGPVSLKLRYTLPADLLPGSSLVTTRFDYDLLVDSSLKDGDYCVAKEHLKAESEADLLISEDIDTATSLSELFNKSDVETPCLSMHTEDVRREVLRQVIGRWRVYQSIPVGRQDEMRRSVESRRAEIVDESGRDLVSVLHTHYTEKPEFHAAIDDAMRAAFGDDFKRLEFSPAEDTRVVMRVRWQSLSEAQSATDLSDGIVRFLFLIALLSSPVLPAVLAIDEPETGLHPSMLPIIAEYAVEASRKTQVILTTHSPEMLSAFRGTIPKVTVAMWENGETVLKTPPDDILQHWLREYSLGNLLSTGQLEEMAESQGGNG